MLFIFNYLFVFSFLGFIIETAFSLIMKHHLEIRKTTRFLPFCTVYGFGAIAMYYALAPFYSYPIIVALLGIIIGTTIEYIYGHFALVLFKVRVWDYSHERRHYKRLIAPIFSIFWCILSLIFIYVVSPIISPLIALFPTYISLTLLLLMIIDGIFTINMFIRIKNGENPERFYCPAMKNA